MSEILTFVLDRDCGTVSVHTDKIKNVETSYDRVCITTHGGGFFYVQLTKPERAQLFRLMATRLEQEEMEALETDKAIA